MTSISRSEGTSSGLGSSSSERLDSMNDTPRHETKSEISAATATPASRQQFNEELQEEGECSDSDALLPTPKTPLSASLDLLPSSHSTSTGTNASNDERARKRSASGSRLEMDIFMNEGEACSPLLTGCDNHAQLLNIEDAMGSTQQVDDKVLHTTRQSTSQQQRASCASLLNFDDHKISFNDEDQTGLEAAPNQLANESDSDPTIHITENQSFTASEGSYMQRFRSISPRTLPQNSQQHSPIRRCQPEHEFPQHSPLDRSIPGSPSVDNDDFTASASTSTRPASPSVISSTPSSHSNSSRETGLGSLRRYVRARATARNSSRGSSSQQPIVANNNTQSLGEEDLFAMTINGEDPRRPVAAADTSSSSLSNSQNALQGDVAPMHLSDGFPPVVWEESDTEPENNERGRRRTFSEPSARRLRDLLFPRAISPGVRRRGSRQSSSVRRHLPRSSSSNSASMLVASPLSTTAAAVLFTSSQASVDSINNGYAVSPQQHHASRQSSRQQQQNQQQHNNRQPRGHSNVTLGDSSSRGLSTLDRSTITDGGGGDSLSISTIGNSTMARPDLPGVGESSRGQPPGAIRASGPYPQGRETGDAANTNAPGSRGGDGNNDETARDREARVRWVRINQRFQLMITFVAILFSLLLFSILISWIVLTSAYVVTFDRTCDVPLKFFYWLVTLQLILDIFRNDIMRYILQWDPAANTGSTHQTIPARVVAYNIAYLAYAMLVLRMGVNCVFIDGQHPESTCRTTSPELFQASLAFISLTLAAWATIILGYLVPFCFVAVLLTWNGFNPGESVSEARVTTGPIPGGVFPNAYSHSGAPPGCIEQLREINLDDCGENAPQECCICMEDFRFGRHNTNDAIIQTDCGHILHKNCCSVWLRQARTCPVCRTDIPNAMQERLQQEQQEMGHQNGDSGSGQEGGQSQQRRPSRVHLSSPNVPFHPAGRHEVENLIRAFRHQRPRGRRNGSRATASATNSDRSRGNPNSQQLQGGRHPNQIAHYSNGNNEPSSVIEIPTLDQHAATSVRTSEGNRSSSNSTANVIDSEAQFVL